MSRWTIYLVMAAGVVIGLTSPWNTTELGFWLFSIPLSCAITLLILWSRNELNEGGRRG